MDVSFEIRILSDPAIGFRLTKIFKHFSISLFIYVKTTFLVPVRTDIKIKIFNRFILNVNSNNLYYILGMY